MSKKLPRADRPFDGANLATLGNDSGEQQNSSNTGGFPSKHSIRMQKRNILAKRLPEIKDLPYYLKLSIFGRGSLMGEEDVFSRSKFSCTLKCYSSKGVVYELPKEHFHSLKNSEQSWLAIMEKIIQKEGRQQATHISHTPRNFDKEDKDRERYGPKLSTIEEQNRSLSPRLMAKSISPTSIKNSSPKGR